MIAASEPLEFIPSGRQQALRHPGLPKGNREQCLDNLNPNFDAFVLHRLERVSLTEENVNEWWTVRETPNSYDSNETNQNTEKYDVTEKKERRCPNDSFSWKTIDPNVSVKTHFRISDITSSKIYNKSRFSSDNEFRNESKTSSKSNKSKLSFNNMVNFEAMELNCRNYLPSMEEELYVKGNTVIWSKGLLSTNPSNPNGMQRITLCSYTMETPVKHALWCTFYLEWPFFTTEFEDVSFKPNEPIGKPIESLCVIDSCNMRVFTTSGEDFITSLPFQITNVWNTKFGILVERESSSLNNSFHKSCTSILDSDTVSNLYSLTHPLDEMCPVAVKTSVFQILNNPTFKVVFFNCEPSICLVYDVSTGLHSVYLYRRIMSDERLEITACRSKLNNSMPSNISQKIKRNLSIWSGHGAGLPLAAGSPCISRANSISSLVSPHSSRTHSPMAAISRCQSPSISPFTSSGGWVNRSSSIQREETLGRMTTGIQNQSKQTTPEFCIENIWTEAIHITKTNFGSLLGPASKAFLTSDLVGQSYLCYLVPIRVQMILVRIDMSNDNNLIFGTSYTLTAKDAVPVPGLHMIAVLDPSCNVVLYSGPSRIGKLHVGGVSAEFSTSPYVMRNAPSYFKSPFPRRSSLLPHATPMSVPRFDEHLISPVHPAIVNIESQSLNMMNSTLLTDPYVTAESIGSTLTGLKDAVSDRITLQYSDNSYYRIILPALASGTLVESCLNALRQSLQRDVALMLLSRWYGTRNAPGPSDFSLEEEWQIFTNLLFGLLGYDVEHLNSNESDRSTTPEEAKRQRPSPQGSSADWELMNQSDQHLSVSKDLSILLNLTKIQKISEKCSPHGKNIQINTNAELFPYIRLVLFTLHLLYEEMKLNTTRLCELHLLAKFLHQLASDLRLHLYIIHYWKDFPNTCFLQTNDEVSQIMSSDLPKINQLSAMSSEPVNIMHHLYKMFNEDELPPYPFIKHVNSRSRKFVQLFGMILAGKKKEQSADINLNKFIKVIVPPGSRANTQLIQNIDYDSYYKWTPEEKTVYLMTEMDITRRDLDNVPAGINLILHEALWKCRENPPTNWNSAAYYLIQRPDLAVQADNSCQIGNSSDKNGSPQTISSARKPYDHEQDDGMMDVESSLLKLRFPLDHRVAEARKLLQSFDPVPIKVVQRPEVSDHDFIEEQEKHLYAICTRTMALPVGRGMFTLRTATPVVTEPLPVPKLCLSGRACPRGVTVELSHIDTPPNMNLWPLFHNGVAAGLRISPDASDIDSTWIVFNKPKSYSETPMEHAGFLMALGLNGHLKNLAVMNMYDYLIKFSEMTSVGLLLGLAATKRGSMDTSITKMLSIHVEALLPPTSMELDIPQNIQVAALLGIGLIYQGSAHRHITEVLLTEIGRPPGPEMENSVDRESYSLAAGLALGLVTLKQGGRPSGFTDLGVPDMLHYYMVGGNKRPLTGSQKDKYKVPSFQIREGSTVNLDVTAPGATLALGLMYLGSGNKAIADWMKPPETQYMFDFVRPDFLMLRIIARALIMWDEIEPTINWVEHQVPEAIKPFCLVKPSTDLDIDIDYEAVNQAYCNIVGGACFAVGLRYAGSADEGAFETLYHYCRMFTSLTGKSIAELAGKPTIETCLNLVLLSLSMVMAGTGRLEVLRLCRHLRKRVGIASSSVITYGSHLITHMALGLLFLGGGRYTLSNSSASVAAMLCAFFPKFPTHSNDNRYHLQAFRHLYVLAVEPRLLVPRDILTGKMCYAGLSVVHIDGTTVNIRAPCILPDLNNLSRVSIQDERYWPVVFERGRNWDQLLKLLNSSRYVKVKQRAGCLSYQEDPMGSRSLLARALTQSSNIPWVPSATAICSFSSEPTVKHFTEDFLTSKSDLVSSVSEVLLRQNLTTVMYECVTKDKIAILPIWVYFIKALQNLKLLPNVIQLWQIKLLFASTFSQHKNNPLISPEIVMCMKQMVLTHLDQWEAELKDTLKLYLCGHPINMSVIDQNKLVSYVTYYDVPHNLNLVLNANLLQVLASLSNKSLNSVTINKCIQILNT